MGLGNPGPRYERTRHNIGFMAIDAIAARLGVSAWRSKHDAWIAHVPSANMLLIKPQTFMNESGRAVAPIAAWWKVSRPCVLVVYDDLDLPFGRLRLRRDGSSGGHNGMKSLITQLGGQDFPRLRIGIGRGGGEREAIDHVLSPFSLDEEKRLSPIIAAAADGAEHWLNKGVEAAVPLVNGWSETVL